MLVELLVASVCALIVFGVLGSFLLVSIRGQNSTSSRAYAVREAQATLAQLTADLRDAQDATDPSTCADLTPVTITNDGDGTSTASLYLPPSGGSSFSTATGACSGNATAGTHVVWTCTAGATCTREAGSATEVRLNGVTSASFVAMKSDGTTVSSPASDPAFVAITLKVQVTSQLDAGQTHVVTGVQNPIVLQDGVGLRNYS
jgi:type II secretory pathway pseudopilin PulG